MADLSITPANVVVKAGAEQGGGTAGEAVTAGQTLYQATDGLLWKADATTAAKAAIKGVALHAAALGQPLAYCKRGGLDVGATVVVGVVYGVTDTGGGIGDISERASDDFITILGVGVAADQIDIEINKSGVAIAAA